jgi:predicted histidine transporter YuiF (NhaC family)
VLVAGVVAAGLGIASVNVVIGLVTGALVGDITGGMPLQEALAVFSAVLGDGAEIALHSALLGAFAAMVPHSCVLIWFSTQTEQFILMMHQVLLKVTIVILLIRIGVVSRNVLPVHIAFMSLLIPSLLGVFAVLKWIAAY